MKRKLILLIASLLAILFLYSCNQTKDVIEDSEKLKNQYLEVISDNVVDFNNYMDTVLFFKTDIAAYRMDLKLSELPLLIRRQMGHCFYLSSDDIRKTNLYIYLDDTEPTQENQNSQYPIFHEEYNDFLIFFEESYINIVYPLPNNDGFLNINWKYSRESFDISDYEVIYQKEIFDFISILSIFSIELDLIENSPIETQYLPMDSSIDIIDLFSYINGSIFNFDNEFSLDLSKMCFGTKTRRAEDTFIQFMPFDESFSLGIFYIPQSSFDTHEIDLSGSELTLPKLLNNFKETITLKGIDFNIYENRVYSDLLLYQGSDFSLLFFFDREENFYRFSLDEKLDILEKIILE